MQRAVLSLFAAACILSDLVLASGIPHALVILDDTHLGKTCHEISRLVNGLEDVFVYLASQSGSMSKGRRACPIGVTEVEAQDLAGAANAAIWDAARELSAFPRSTVALLDSRAYDFNMEAVKSLLLLSKKSKKPTIFPVRFVVHE